MKQRRAFALIDNLITFSLLLISTAVLIPFFVRARDNARRSNCQSNQKQIAIALFQYAADNNGDLPGHNWVVLAKPYIKARAVFRCPSKGSPTGVGGYFFNARFLTKKLGDISQPQGLILMGDGNGDSPLSQFPSTWLPDKYSPAWRHLGGANYCFADGHIKWLKPSRVANDFRVVNP